MLNLYDQPAGVLISAVAGMSEVQTRRVFTCPECGALIPEPAAVDLIPDPLQLHNDWHLALATAIPNFP